MPEDNELQAMGAVLSALLPLDSPERKRVLNWAMQKLAVDVQSSNAGAQQPIGPMPPGAVGRYSNDTIANLIGATSGPDLIIAAAAHLHFSQGKATFTRRELAAEMRNSPSRFKYTFMNNLSAYLAGLTRADRLRLSANDTYALSNNERQNLESRLAAAR
jgi:hypothetical protein